MKGAIYEKREASKRGSYKESRTIKGQLRHSHVWGHI